MVVLVCMQANDYSLTYVDSGILTSTAPTTAVARLRNSANTTVSASRTSIQSAMTDFRAALISGGRPVLASRCIRSLLTSFVTGASPNLFNGPGAQSYPLSFLHYLTTNTSRTSNDCYSIEQYLIFLSWTQYVSLRGRSVHLSDARGP